MTPIPSTNSRHLLPFLATKLLDAYSLCVTLALQPRISQQLSSCSSVLWHPFQHSANECKKKALVLASQRCQATLKVGRVDGIFCILQRVRFPARQQKSCLGKIQTKGKGLHTFCGKIQGSLFSSVEKSRWRRAEKRSHLQQMCVRTVSALDRVERIEECPILN